MCVCLSVCVWTREEDSEWGVCILTPTGREEQAHLSSSSSLVTGFIPAHSQNYLQSRPGPYKHLHLRV